MANSTLGQRLKALRMSHPDKPNQYDVAAAAGISRTHLTKLETDAYPEGRMASPLRGLADFYRVSIDYLETGADPSGDQVPDEGFSSEDKRAWLLVGSTIGHDGRIDVFRYLRERSSPSSPADSKRRPRNKK